MATANKKQRIQEEGEIRKLETDWEEEWGDGGGGIMAYPVWISDNLVFGARETLVRQMRAMDQSDVQPNGIVHDIIDPCLHANTLSTAEHEEIFSNFIETTAFDDEEEEEEEETAEAQAQKKALECFKESSHLRTSYQWVPTVIKCHYDSETMERRAEFLGDIAGLPERSRHTEPLYSGLEELFTSLLPMLARADLRGVKVRNQVPVVRDDQRKYVYEYVPKPHEALNNGELQVVFKVQEYVLPPNSTYTGRWHTEGATEYIAVAGVYYLDISKHCTGGSLCFRPSTGPDNRSAVWSHEDGDQLLEEQTREEYEAAAATAASSSSAAAAESEASGVEKDETEEVLEETSGDNEAQVQEEVGEISEHQGAEQEPEEVSMEEDDTNGEHADEPSEDDEQDGDNNDGSNEETNIVDAVPEEDGEEDREFWHHYIREVPVQTGTAVVFENSIPHRFRTIRNDTDQPQRRLFINFFISSPEPECRLEVTTSSRAGRPLLRRVLSRLGLAGLQSNILSYVGGYANPDALHRKILRDKARAAMSKNRGRWDTYMFGNNGDLFYTNDCRIEHVFSERVGNYVESGCPTSQLGSGL